MTTHLAALAAAVIALSGAGGLAARQGAPSAQVPGPGSRVPDPDLVAVELSTVGVDPRSGTPIVLLREPTSGRVVPIWVGEAEARAIALALHGVAMPRPMTHDLMASLLSELKATVEEVVVHNLVENTYLGTIRLKLPGDGEVRDVDSRPSDALALALRTGASIRVARKILERTPDFDFVAPEGPDQIVQLIGITVVSPTPALRREHATGNRDGVLVTRVTGRAQERGVRTGDLIVAVNGRPVREPMDFFRAIRAARPDQSIRLVVVRPGEEIDIELPSDLPPVPIAPADRRRV